MTIGLKIAAQQLSIKHDRPQDSNPVAVNHTHDDRPQDSSPTAVNKT